VELVVGALDSNCPRGATDEGVCRPFRGLLAPRPSSWTAIAVGHILAPLRGCPILCQCLWANGLGQKGHGVSKPYKGRANTCRNFFSDYRFTPRTGPTFFIRPNWYLTTRSRAWDALADVWVHRRLLARA